MGQELGADNRNLVDGSARAFCSDSEATLLMCCLMGWERSYQWTSFLGFLWLCNLHWKYCLIFGLSVYE